MNISGYVFEGPYSLDSAEFNAVSAVYVISDVNRAPLDVGQTSDLSARMATHDREDCWRRNAKGQVMVYARVENSESARLELERVIRNRHSFTCGVF